MTDTIPWQNDYASLRILFRILRPGDSIQLSLGVNVFLSNSSIASAQTTDGSITIQTVDAIKALIPGTHLVLTDNATGVTREGTTLSSGTFTFTALSTSINLEEVNNLLVGNRSLIGIQALSPGYASTTGNGTFNGTPQAAYQGNLDGINSTSSRSKAGNGSNSAVTFRVENTRSLLCRTVSCRPARVVVKARRRRSSSPIAAPIYTPLPAMACDLPTGSGPGDILVP